MIDWKDLSKYEPFYEVRWFEIDGAEGSETYNLDELDEAERLYQHRLRQDTWDFLELKLVLDFDFKVVT